MSDLLAVRGLRAGYGEAVVLDGIDFALAPGESLALLGRNGVGKTTLLVTLMGLTRCYAGSIELAGLVLDALPTHRRAAAGLGWVPQERLVFPSLTVEEHLTAVARPGPWTLARVYSTFPRLAERRTNYGGQLSGGEQQMLAMARALMTNPRVLLLDEPMEGLAPIIVADLVRIIGELVNSGECATIVVEQHAKLALGLTQTALVLDRGRAVHYGPSSELAADPERLARLLAVS